MFYTDCFILTISVDFPTVSCLERLPCLLWLSWFSGCSVLSTILSTQIVLLSTQTSYWRCLSLFPHWMSLVYKDCSVCIHILGVSGCSVFSSILSTQICLHRLYICYPIWMSCLERLPRLHSLSWCKWFFCSYWRCQFVSPLNVLFRKTACLLWLSWFSGFSVLSTILSTQIVLFILTISFDFPQCLV